MHHSRFGTRTLTRLIAIVWASGLLVASVSAQQPGLPTSLTHEAVVARIADLRKITTPNGIEALEELEIDGTRQWISIRGRDRANPILLMIHGGPGSPTMPVSWAFQGPWEDYFTVVQWDQRGVGKNALTADHAALAPTLTVESSVADAEAVVAHLRRRLDQDRVVVMGYSWGSIVGSLLAQRRPEWLYAYVGVGQASYRGDDYLFTRLIELATAARNQEALAELRTMAPYPNGVPPVQSVVTSRKWARHFGGAWYGRTDFGPYSSAPDWAPEYSDAERAAMDRASGWATVTLLAEMFSQRLDTLPPFKVPVVVLMGRHDLHTPHQPAREMYDRLEAPRKRFITFELSAHVPMMEEPGRFLRALIDEVLPLTRTAAARSPR
ncbi:MAG: alpha/beta hydrolase [Gemmatimonadales bacterium]|nr:alpha/beta hydrolase [Gemmatimonadales bacterium]